jgi:hypothetical protein
LEGMRRSGEGAWLNEVSNHGANLTVLSKSIESREEAQRRRLKTSDAQLTLVERVNLTNALLWEAFLLYINGVNAFLRQQKE